MEDIVMRNIYQIMVDMLNEMKRLNDTLERSKIDVTRRDAELCDNRSGNTETDYHGAVQG